MVGIASKRALLAVSQHQGFGYVNIAHADIQSKRSRVRVPCGPGGYLNDYVPFYFAPRSPMLCAISHDRVAGYAGSQSDVVYLTSSTEQVAVARLRFAFTDGHAVMSLSGFYDNLDDLGKIDWPLMKSKYWSSTEEDPDRPRRRQAEFLAFHSLSLDLVTELTVMNQSIANQMRKALVESGTEIPVAVRSNWYF